MSPRPLWAVTLLVALSLVCVTVLLALHVSPTAVISVISILVLPVMGAVLYEKVGTIEKQTNGTVTRLQDTVDGLVEHLKKNNSVPVEPAVTKEETHAG